MAKNIDWGKIEAQYRAALLSNRQIAEAHGITEGAIRKRAKAENWIKDGNVRPDLVNVHFQGEMGKASTSDFPQSEFTETSGTQRDPIDQQLLPESVLEKDEPMDELMRTERIEAGSRYAGNGSHHNNREARERYAQREAYRLIYQAAQEDISDMDLGLANARMLLEITASELDNILQRSRNLSVQGHVIDDDDAPKGVDSRRLDNLVKVNTRAIEMIRQIRGLDKELPDEIQAIKVLVEAGWLPMEILLQVLNQFRMLKPNLERDFREHFREDAAPTTASGIPEPA